MSKASGIAWRKRNLAKEAERAREWRKKNPGASTRQTREWRAANPEMAKAAELRNQHRRLMKRLAYGPVPLRRKRTTAPRSKYVADLPVVQRWLTQEQWNG